MQKIIYKSIWNAKYHLQISIYCIVYNNTNNQSIPYCEPCEIHRIVGRYLEDARFIVYEDEREMMVTQVSAYGLQRQSNIGTPSSIEVSKSLRLHIEHMNSYDKTILTRTFLIANNDNKPSCHQVQFYP